MTIPQDYQALARSMADKAAMQNTKLLTKQTNAHDYYRTHPDIIAFTKAFQWELNQRNIPFYPFYFYRSMKLQGELYRRRPRVTNADAGQSPHNYGCAVDMVHLTKLWDMAPDHATNARMWDIIGVIGKEVARKRKIKMRWGGDWDGDGVPVRLDPDEKFWDPAHWELENWRELRAAHNQYVDEGFNPGLLSDADYFAKLERIASKKKR